MSMGRPVVAKSEEYKRKLKWLDPEKYFKDVKGLDAYGWRDQLAFRRDLLDRTRMVRGFSKELFQEFGGDAASDVALIEQAPRALFQLVQKTPLVDIEKVEEEYGPNVLPRLHYIRRVSSYQHLAVRPMTVEELYLAEAAANPVKVHEARRFFGSLGNSLAAIEQGKSYDTYFDQYSRAYYERWWDANFPGQMPTADEEGDESVPYELWMADPLHKHGYSTGRLLLSVDSSAPDSRLVEQFKAAVAEARGTSEKVEMPQLNISSWGDAGLLPYIDLQIWALLNDEPEIDRPIVRDAILPFGRREDHIVKHVTEPAYNKLMNSTRQEFTILVMKVAEEMLLRDAETEAAEHRVG